MKLRLSITVGGHVQDLIIETVDGVPEIRRERDPVASRDRSIDLSFESFAGQKTEAKIAVEEAL